jgi:hypothetical protein
MNAVKYKCPDDAYMCKDPGLLTCLGALNDCSGRGDCFKGSCDCHLGWGGADCFVPICVPATGCPDVRSPALPNAAVYAL